MVWVCQGEREEGREMTIDKVKTDGESENEGRIEKKEPGNKGEGF